LAIRLGVQMLKVEAEDVTLESGVRLTPVCSVVALTSFSLPLITFLCSGD
jgi:hypothetical protein